MSRDDADDSDICRRTLTADNQSCRWSLGSHSSNPGKRSKCCQLYTLSQIKIPFAVHDINVKKVTFIVRVTFFYVFNVFFYFPDVFQIKKTLNICFLSSKLKTFSVLYLTNDRPNCSDMVAFLCKDVF